MIRTALPLSTWLWIKTPFWTQQSVWTGVVIPHKPNQSTPSLSLSFQVTGNGFQDLLLYDLFFPLELRLMDLQTP